MNLKEAIVCALGGKKIRRTNWGDGEFVVFEGVEGFHYFFKHMRYKTYNFSVMNSHIEWEIYAPKTLFQDVPLGRQFRVVNLKSIDNCFVKVQLDNSKDNAINLMTGVREKISSNCEVLYEPLTNPE